MQNAKTKSTIALLLTELTLLGSIVWKKEQGDFRAEFKNDQYKISITSGFLYQNDFNIGWDSNADIKNLISVVEDQVIGNPTIKKLQDYKMHLVMKYQTLHMTF